MSKLSRIFLLAPIALIIAILVGAPFTYAQTSVTSGTVYSLVSKTSALVLDNGGSITPGTALAQTALGAGNTNQQWQIVSAPNSAYQIINLSSGLALDTGGSTTSGAAVVQNVSSSATTSQQWVVTSLGSGYFQIKSESSGLALDNGGSTSSGGTVQQVTAVSGDSNQEWEIEAVQIGASVPFISYEAESGTLGGEATIVSLTSPPTTEFSSPQLEASGHAYVNLGATGQSVTWTNNTGLDITFINVRYSIPDSSGGGGITSTLDLYVNGTFRQALNVNSIQTWLYESSSSYDGMSQTPSSGNPHIFWDETHAFITGAAIAPGSTITLQKDSANSAAYYHIDVIDLEAPPAPLTQPANTLSITTNCGAVASSALTNGTGASGAVDSTSAIQNCINQAQSSGQAVWIPEGTFYLNTSKGLTMNGITMEGAGMWYSKIYYNVPIPATSTSNPFSPTSSTLKDFAIDGDAVAESTAGGNGGAIYINGNNWLIDSLWISHEGAGVWASGTNGTVQNCRLNNTWADGININNGNGGNGYTIGNNLTVKNNFIRGSGDDGLAVNDSTDNPDQSEMLNPVVINNTVVAPWWANLMGIYGGANVLAANNYLHDAVKGNGIYIGGYDSTGYGAPLETALVQGNTVIRGGSFGYGNRNPGIAVGYTSTNSPVGMAPMTNMNVRGNTDVDAMFDGVDFEGGTGTVFSNNTVVSPGGNGFAINGGGAGDAFFGCNTLTGLASGEQGFVNNAGSSFVVTGNCNVGFSVPSSSLAAPTLTLTLSASSITPSQSLTATVVVSGGSGKATPTGSVIVTSGNYSSAATTLSNGSATVTIAAGTLGLGEDTLIATYTPDATSSPIYTPASGTALVKVASTIAEGPYGGTPAAVPGTVMAENYDTGGQGVGYSVTSTNGSANSYRSDGVDLEAATSPATSNDLGWSAAGQWFRYTVNVSTAGTYTVSFLVASPTAVTDAFHLSNSSGTNLSGSVAVPATGGYQTWITVKATVTLPAGTQTLTLNEDAAGWNIDSLAFASSGGGSCTTKPNAPTGLAASGTSSTGTTLNWTADTAPANCSISSYTVLKNGASIGTATGTSFAVTGLSASTTYSFTVEATDAAGTSAASSAVSVTTSAASGGEAPYPGPAAAAVPGTVLAENYDAGGQGVAYNVTSTNGTANTYRTGGVDLEAATAPATGNDLGWSAAGQWFRYTVNAATAGSYTVSFLVASPTAVADAFHLSNASGTNLTGSVAVPATGGYQTWVTVTASVTLPAGTQTLTLNDDAAGWNIDSIAFASSGGTGTPVIQIDCGGAASGTWVADTDFTGGTAVTTTNTITTTGVTNPAPQAVYQSNRYNAPTYTIGGLTAGTSYTVRLHFAETYWTAAGQREFNVSINGAQVLTNFDIFATAGGENIATVKQFTATANSSGQIVITSTSVVDNAQFNGIEVDH
jgi:hypothetical protein